MKKLLLISLLILLAIPLITSQQVFKQSTDINVSIPCIFNQTQCSSGATCNYSVFDSNETRVKNGTLTPDINSLFYVSLNSSQSSEIGEYNLKLFCEEQSIFDSPTVQILITPSGTELSEGQGTIYVLVLVLFILTFAGSVFASIKIKWKDTRNEEGKIVDINDLKWFKIFFIVVSYLLLMGIFLMIEGVSRNFLFVDSFSLVFRFLFNAMLYTFWPLIILVAIFSVILFFQDKKFKELIDRGLLPT